ncbi:MAG: 5'/3'-nucleotidase SurE [Candidatus Eisenbacteria sp.]|nr:5'/3'-nucleotidase SurE [Candidatus Eisenbacteria bacterium]
MDEPHDVEDRLAHYWSEYPRQPERVSADQGPRPQRHREVVRHNALRHRIRASHPRGAARLQDGGRRDHVHLHGRRQPHQPDRRHSAIREVGQPQHVLAVNTGSIDLDRPRILISNDDGVHARGIKALRKALEEVADVTVVAPDRERSGASHSLTMDVPLRTHRIKENIIGVDGTPTDCVLLALKLLLPEPPDLVVSGINRGANMGDDVTYSGTIAAAMEATLMGIPAIAVSLCRCESGAYDYEASAEIAREVALMVLERGLPEGTLLNVNVPNIPREEITGVEIARLGKQVYEEAVVEKQDPRGRTYYWIGGQLTSWEPEPDTDYAAVSQRLVSITPIHLDLTDYRAMDVLRSWPLEQIVAAGIKTPGAEAVEAGTPNSAADRSEENEGETG